MVYVLKKESLLSLFANILIVLSIITTFRGGTWFVVELFIFCLLFIVLNVIYFNNGNIPIMIFLKDNLCLSVVWLFSIINYLFLSKFIYNNFTYVDLRRLLLWFLSISIGYMIIDIGGIFIINKILKSIWIIVFFNVLLSFYEYLTKSNPFFPLFNSAYHQSPPAYYRTASLFANPIPFCTCMILIFWLTFYLFKGKKRKWIYSILILWAILLNKSRSGWVSLGITAIIYLLKCIVANKKLTLKKVINFILKVMILFYMINFSQVFNYIKELIVERFMQTSGSVSESQRIGTILYLLNDFRNNSSMYLILFGHGAGYSWKKISNTTISINGFTTTDNQYLTILADYGIIALCIVSGFILFLCIDIFKRKEDMIIYIDLSILTFFIISFFFESLNFSNVSTCVFLVIAIRLYLHNNEGRYFLINKLPNKKVK